MREHHGFKLILSFSVRVLPLAVMTLSLTACGFPQQRETHRADTELQQGWPKPNEKFRQVSLPEIRAMLPVIEGAEYINDDELCMTCHQVYAQTFQQNVHRGIHQEGQACEACHGPASRHVQTRGKEPGLLIDFKTLQPAQASEACLRCHEQNACAPGASWRTSKHAHAGMSCVACHQTHYNVPPGTRPTTAPGEEARDDSGAPTSLVSFMQELDQVTLRTQSNNLNAMAPESCYRCHGDLKQSSMVAGPHQIGGANCFNCTSCHNAHGQIVESSRKELCLQCHSQHSPTMAFHSSTHDLMGVACTDCHNPHPRPGVQAFPHATGVDLLNTHVSRSERRAMSVQEPEACYKCHPKVFAESHLPSHHPIREGKMVCSDCHDAHGQREGSLQAESTNLLCWKCHADKQGPFAYEHPPVTEDCGICHSPHGTVTNNLLKQPATFLCLRCHDGHRDGNHGSGTRLDIDDTPQLRKALYSDCTQCHAQIHGSDLPTPHFPSMFR